MLHCSRVRIRVLLWLKPVQFRFAEISGKGRYRFVVLLGHRMGDACEETCVTTPDQSKSDASVSTQEGLV